MLQAWSALDRQRLLWKPPMAIEISKEARKQAIASIERYFQENM